jgi:hypothetical protein
MGQRLGEKLVTSCPVTRIDLPGRIVNGEFAADKIVTSIPWTIWPRLADIPRTIKTCIRKLEKASVDVDYVPEDRVTDAHWIYVPADNLSYHRILCRANFCEGSRGCWTETNSLRAEEQNGWRHRNEYAYPLNTTEKPGAITEIRRWASQHHIIPLGRWGLWEHMNSDVAVAEGVAAAQEALRDKGPWT